ncbi:MAG: chorismate-binding protein [Planctomycetota bacterium]|nr:chorismate-binding protein [Planctomycetota bacterium]
MPYPRSFEQLARPGLLVPVRRTFTGDGLTPVAAFRRIHRGEYGFLLESVERGERIGRYSFVGSSPEAVFRGTIFPSFGYEVLDTRSGALPGASPAGGGSEGRELPRAIPIPAVSSGAGDPIRAFAEYFGRFRAAEVEGLPPFAGGAVGYFGYDTVRAIERLPNPPPRRISVPDMQFMIFRTQVIFDHVKNLVHVVHYADPSDGGPARACERAAEVLEDTARRLSEPADVGIDDFPVPLPDPPGGTVSNLSREEFVERVRRAKEYIAAGDIIQVVLSQRFSLPCPAPPFEIYRALRAINPSPYMFYLHMGDLHLVGSSPEVMVRVEGRRVLVRPIAGTRPRGALPEEDERLGRELLSDPKELAEHAMLLDLGRNDVGRVSEMGSVRIEEQMVLEHYSHVMHIVSTVTGRLRPGLGAFDALRACMPAGTVTGAPKIRAMEIIDELEPETRGPYAGAVGIMDFAGNMNTAITIRTVMVIGGEAHIQAGAGIVADSDPGREYEETINKAKGMLKALGLARTFMSSRRKS